MWARSSKRWQTWDKLMVPDLRIDALRDAYRKAHLDPVDLFEELSASIAGRGDDGVWITLSDRLAEDAAALDPSAFDAQPLWGIPFAIKDNIDVAGLPTTAACPEFAYVPEQTAVAVERLREAGAVLVGKTNLDQFATGLNGTRTPYTTPRAHHDASLISGGSSSGSALAVAAGLVSFALGTDTAGSGRVPAALNGVVGLKPSLGAVSNRGVVPACRSLDCVSVMALSVADAHRVSALLMRHDPADPWSRSCPPLTGPLHSRQLQGVRFGIPAQVPRWGSRGEREAWEEICAVLERQGAVLIRMDYAPLFEAGAQLYGGPWLAERAGPLRAFTSARKEAVHPVVAALLQPASQMTATETFAAQHRMQQLRREAAGMVSDVDALLSPTVTETFTVEEMKNDPVDLNSRLGTFTTYTNLLRLCGVAVPVTTTATGHPFGVTLQAGDGQDQAVAELAEAVEAAAAPHH